MTGLFKTRLQRHLREMAKYLRLVFNDFFVFALLFFLGGLGWGYSNVLKTLKAGLWWAPLVVLLVLVIVAQIGRFATLIEDADRVFLLPRERAMHAYLVAARRYSQFLAQCTQLIALFILAPFLSVALGWTLPQVLVLALAQVVLKDSLLRLDLASVYQVTGQRRMNQWPFKWLLAIVVVASGVWLSPYVGLLLALVADGAVAVWERQHWQSQQIRWREQIKIEDNRMLGIYRFFNMFTEVPMVSGTIKRRRYLDWLFKGIKPTHSQTYLYLFSRGMVRGSDFSGLVVRLTVIGMLLLYFVRGEWLPVILAALFIYLIGFQLLPFFQQYDDVVFTHVYPVLPALRLKNFVKLVTLILSTTALLLWVVVVIANPHLMTAGITLAVEVVEVWYLARIYTPHRLARADQK
ncbi:MAG: ABC transporter permease [Levilactobacillus sp.]|jgi:ABC-2 type transport system permease protein|uniref:ABC transporter permease n=1 Tax=Levilactobacillus sp. TaxID=2767919 RepID=UPI00258CA65E|nr:ABC transporter permease [Levilactobacillus sp.]MCH4123082.1 ABC transporter permease [Levilactobacillus sp.]MCI1552780.1 ABC transporter permease [Levilactobacillus sp.]MCI1598869.1 ABC transporter permease [Levilactobacillus sp.]MCI1606518.1 ABC transporter permease [Levilactobacillus sp.]